MGHKLLSPDEAVDDILEQAKKGGKKYQEETGCTDEERNRFETLCALGVSVQLWKD